MKLKPIQVIGYGSGDAANNLAFSITAIFLLVYYTDVAGISAAAAATMFLLVRIWDAFTDILAGRIVDKTHTRWGKFRPFLLFGSVPLMVLTFLTFHVPDWSHGGKVAYAYVTYGLLGLAYSFVNIPYGSLATAMTQQPRERAKLASARGIGAGAIILVLVLAISPQLSGNAQNLQRTFSIITGAFVILGIALYLFAFFTSRENVERDVAQVSFKETLASLRHNAPLLRLCLSTVSYLVGMFAFNTIGIYYARDVLGNASLFIPLTVLGTGVMFVVAPIAPKIVATLGKRTGYQVAAGFSVIGGIGVFLAPASHPAVALVSWTIAGIGLALVNTLMWALEADTVEYGEWKSGVRTEGATYAIFSFTRKCGQALGGSAAGYALALGGYHADAAVQSGSTLTAIRVAAGLLPAGFALLAALIMFTYPLTESRFATMVEEVRLRRGQQPVPVPSAAVDPQALATQNGDGPTPAKA
ncbi:MAG TPA: glucuronide transporter [Segeticoccus sp.]|uniref:glucuronide transporter n=1 Tax=Segeticoccus sp. TaxID=2706531 RepID=UPI002D7FEF87|nr:glucuronide transporter [Segeticoccus sp.]HET8601418.1 glucuronide transporter [Segeticoccus sp.]